MFIDQHLASVSLVKTTSTMAAVEAVLSDETRTSAAIASKHSVTLFQDLQVLHEGIQDETCEFPPRFFARVLISGYVYFADSKLYKVLCIGKVDEH
jgi:prephenate dehydratase